MVPPAVSRALIPVLARIQAAYEHQNLRSVSALIANGGLARSVRRQMQRWIEEGVHPLRLTLVYARSLTKGRFVGTVAFSSDPLAIPDYMIFVFRRERQGLRIVGTTSGITGTTYDRATWTVTRSAHFKVYHSRYQLAGTDAGALANLEAERTLFERRFGVRVASTIDYYLYPAHALMGSMSRGACGRTAELLGCALPYENPPLIHTIEWPSYHEPIHVYELALEPPIQRNGSVYLSPLFIAEGTAVALEDKELDPRFSDYCSDLTYIPLDACAQQVQRDANPLKFLTDRQFEHGNLGDEYLVAGSFVKYLILHFGYRRFGKFYYTLAAQPKDTLHDYTVATQAVFHASMRALVAHWSAALCRSGC